MSFTEQDLDNLSTLARISVSEDEKQKMLQDMQSILEYVSEINGIEGVSERAKDQVFNVVREDVVTRLPGSNTEAILREAPSVKDGYIKVEQVLK